MMLFALIYNLPLIFLSLLTAFHTAGRQSPKNNKHTNNKVTLSS